MNLSLTWETLGTTTPIEFPVRFVIEDSTLIPLRLMQEPAKNMIPVRLASADRAHHLSRHREYPKRLDPGFLQPSSAMFAKISPLIVEKILKTTHTSVSNVKNTDVRISFNKIPPFYHEFSSTKILLVTIENYEIFIFLFFGDFICEFHDNPSLALLSLSIIFR